MVFQRVSESIRGIKVIHTSDMPESVLLTDSVTEGLKVTKTNNRGLNLE